VTDEKRLEEIRRKIKELKKQEQEILSSTDKKDGPLDYTPYQGLTVYS